MTGNKLKGNLAMTLSKIFSGLNENALKYLVPTWMSPFSGAVIRLAFGAVGYWVTGIFTRKKSTPATARQKLMLFLMGAVLVFGYMFTLLAGLKYTTPISSSIFISLQPAIVFIISAIFLKEKVTRMKIIGILLGLAGAMIIISTQKTTETASNPLLGNLFCLGSAICYSLYLIFSGYFLKKLDVVTVSKWSFLGGLVSSAISICFIGWDAIVLTQNLFSTPMLVLAFVLICPTFISYFLVAVGIKNLKVTVVALYSNLILVTATIFSYIFGQDIFSWWQIAAIVLIIVSVYFMEVAEAKTPVAPAAANASKGNDKTGAVVTNVNDSGSDKASD